MDISLNFHYFFSPQELTIILASFESFCGMLCDFFFFSVFMYILLTFVMLNLFYNLCINIKPRILPVNFLCFIPQHSYIYSFFNSLTVNPWIYHVALAITKNIFSVESFFSFLYINVKLLSYFVQGIPSSFCTSLQLYSFLNFTYKIGYFIGYIVQ